MSDEPRRGPHQRTPAGVTWSDGSARRPKADGDAPAPASARVVPAQVRAAQARAVASVTPAGALARARSSGVAKQQEARRAAQQPTKKPASDRPPFYPLEPRSFEEAGVDPSAVESIILRYLMGERGAQGRTIAEEACLPLAMIRDVLDQAKTRKLVNYRGTTALGDMVCELTEAGFEKALQSRKVTSYVGPAPVPWAHYVQALKFQALKNNRPGPSDLQRAFSDLFVSEDLFERLGPAVTSCQALFLHGEPGNGKTSLAERMTRCFGDDVWVPYTLDIGGHLVKLYDPAVHEELEPDPVIHKRRDKRWTRIRRPTVIAGGELTLEMLEIQEDTNSNVCEAPLHLKANTGTFVIDDFGRGNTKPQDLLNRWIYPLEKRADFLSLPDGRKFSAPFDCLLVFSTNLEPRDLADEAFLRRIPYKIYVGDPLEDEFAGLVEQMAEKLGVKLLGNRSEDGTHRSVKYLIDRHYKMPKRAMRMCHPRDLLKQVKHLCQYERRPAVAGPKEWDRVVANYFGY